MHGRNVVHGCLDPSHVVWFATDFCWKLVNLKAASAVGDPIPVNIGSSPAYAAPETLEAAERDSGDARSSASSDMWSFGLVAYGVLTGTVQLQPRHTSSHSVPVFRRVRARRRRCQETRRL